MIKAKSFEEIAEAIETEPKLILFFSADWCGDCQFIYPVMPDIEKAHPEYKFIQIDRDDFMPLAQEWNIFGIPSFIVLHDGKETGRLVNKLRKTKEEINQFLDSI